MELIIMCILTISAMLIGIFIGRMWGLDVGMDIGYNEGLKDGEIKVNKNIGDFPTTLDGKFFSTDAAIRQMSNKAGD